MYSPNLRVNFPHLFFITQKLTYLETVWGTNLQTFIILIFPSWIFQIIRHFSQKCSFSPHCNKCRNPKYSLTSICGSTSFQGQESCRKEGVTRGNQLSSPQVWAPLTYSSGTYYSKEITDLNTCFLNLVKRGTPISTSKHTIWRR